MSLDEDVGEELLDACVCGDFDQAHWILRKNRNFANWSEPEQRVSILHTMAYHDLLEPCRLLLSYGADVNRKNKNGETPLYWAVRMNCFQVAMTLLDYGADANCLDNSGSTPLHYACCHAVPEMIPLLLSYKCDPNIKDVDGKTALESIEKEIAEDFFACTVLIRRHMNGTKSNKLSENGATKSPHEGTDNLYAFELSSTGSGGARMSRTTNKKKFQVPRSYSPHKGGVGGSTGSGLKKPDFIAGSKTYYLHPPNSYTQKMHQDVTRQLMSQTAMHQGGDEAMFPELRESNSAPVLNWEHAKRSKHHPVSHKSFGSPAHFNGESFALGENNAHEQLGEMPFIPCSTVSEHFDVIISVEHCCNCHLHGASVRHSKKKYATVADECLRAVVIDVMKHCSHLRVIGLKAESKPSRIGALEVNIAMYLPSSDNNGLHDSWNWKCKSLYSKLSTKSWPKVKNFGSRASEFLLEMLDLYGSRDGEVRTEGKVGGEENDIKASNLSDEEDCYNFMRSVVKSRALCKDDTHAENIESKNISESGGVGDVSMNDIEVSYLRWVERTYGSALSESAKKIVTLPGTVEESSFTPHGIFISPPPPTSDKIGYESWSLSTLNHFIIYDGRLSPQQEQAEDIPVPGVTCGDVVNEISDSNDMLSDYHSGASTDDRNTPAVTGNSSNNSQEEPPGEDAQAARKLSTPSYL